jgi:glycosyltransferase involved in cell wall biosynthesis
MNKPKLAILTLHPHNYGGVLSAMQAVWQFAEQHFEPRLFFASFDPSVAAHFRSGKFGFSSQPQTFFNMSGVAVGTWLSHWEPGHYWFNRHLWAKELADYDYFFVVSGTPIAGHPLVALNKKFILWAATPYDGDRQQRVELARGVHKLIDRCAVPVMRKIEKKILNSATHALGMSDYATNGFNEILGNTKAVTCSYPMPLRPEVAGVRAPIIVAAARWTDPRKNVAMLLKAFELVYQQRPDAQLHLFGQPPVLDAAVTQQAWFKNVTLHGYVDRAVVDELYRRAQLLVISSFQEGFGITGLEAFSHGVPVISTDCGGPRDFVVDDHNGYLVPVDDAEAMAARMLQVLGDVALHQRLAHGARQTIAQKFDTPLIHEQWKKILVDTYPELSALFVSCKPLDLEQRQEKAL